MEYPTKKVLTKHGLFMLTTQSANKAHIACEKLDLNGIIHRLSAHVELVDDSVELKHVSCDRDAPIFERKETTRNAYSKAYALVREVAPQAFTPEAKLQATRTQYSREATSCEAKMKHLHERLQKWALRAKECREAALMPDAGVPMNCGTRASGAGEVCTFPDGHATPHSWERYEWD